MYQLSEQAQKLIEDFEKQIEKLPVEERNTVIKRMTSHILALNEEVGEVLKIVQDSRHRSGVDDQNSKEGKNDIDNIRDFI